LLLLLRQAVIKMLVENKRIARRYHLVAYWADELLRLLWDFCNIWLRDFLFQRLGYRG
jgi:uncharacterized Fe-S radical SAM superfamily protein PflX